MHDGGHFGERQSEHMKRVCIYCGSYSGTRHTYVEVAYTLGVMLAQRGIGVVYGGGYEGLMGVVADAVLAEGGEVVGVATGSFIASARSHNGLTELSCREGLVHWRSFAKSSSGPNETGRGNLVACSISKGIMTRCCRSSIMPFTSALFALNIVPS
jgi:hypothetical protein